MPKKGSILLEDTPDTHIHLFVTNIKTKKGEPKDSPHD